METMIMALVTFAADLPPPDAVPPATLPVEVVNWLNLLITGLTPVVTLGIKKLIPKVPRVVLPLAAPLIGIALDYVLRLASVETGGPWMAMVFGSLGTWLYQAQKEVRLVASEKALVPITPPALNVKGKDTPV